MAGDLGLGFNMGSLVHATDAFTQVLYYILYAIIIGGGIWFTVYWLSFKHRVMVYYATKGSPIVVPDKARQFKDKTGVVKWLLWKHRKDGALGVPDNDCLEITNKGKFAASVIRSPEGTYTWVKADRLMSDYENYKQTNPNFEPFRSEERTMAVYEYQQAELYKKKKWTDVAVQVAPLLTLLMILTVFMLFFNEAVAPTYEYGNTLVKAGDRIDAAMGKIEAVCLQRPTIPGQSTGVGNVSVLPPN